ncbi:serine/threonine-protein kinase PRP4 homolog isoform X2 [Macrosteles quadrilineatus]|uniref:serine/threonine-protein kinase PRP4 homolog isoform X2 n=1 Tax=Macrosteles quadrilineatus TaxID=74068 RepID=UPI0023E3068C|nr:serine/threonine-protein kinase PRP4 homolog isoform X2 [Macrosteles quadrilineatus]
MSTTSTTNGRHRKRRLRRRLDDGVAQETENSSWSNNKLKQELSSFIAEFSYLTDPSKKSQTKELLIKNRSETTPQQNIQIFAAREQMNSPFDDPELRRRGVEWEDQHRETPVYSAQGSDCKVPKRDKGFRRAIVRRPRLRIRRSRSTRQSTSRDLGCPNQARSVRKVRRRFSGFRASKSRSRRIRARSCRSETPIRRRVRSHFRRRSRSPSFVRSAVKDMPFRSRERRIREIVDKKSKPKLLYKSIEPCSEPTLVTLFPRTIKRKPLRFQSRELELPCRCDMCTNKYESLARLHHGRFNPCNLPHAPFSRQCGPCPPKCQIVPRDQSACTPKWHCNTGKGKPKFNILVLN